MNEMLNITRAELLLLLILSFIGGQVFALAYSHHLWPPSTCLALGSASAAILAIVFAVYRRNSNRQHRMASKHHSG